MSLYRRAAIVGIGHTEYSKDSGRSEWQLAVEAISAALQDAGIDPREVDGLVRYSYDNVTPPQIVRSFSLPLLRFYADVPLGGTAAGAVITQAAGAIASGQASVVVVYRAMNERSGVRYGRAERSTGQTSAGFVAKGDSVPAGAFAAPYGLLSPGQLFALNTNRYAHDNGASTAEMSRALGTVAVQQRAYANNNPDAMMRDKPMTMDDYEASRPISSPLRLFDMCLESDGAVAVVLVDADRAAALRDDAAYVLTGAEHLRRDPASSDPSLHTRLGRGPIALVERLYEEARLAPTDVDVALIYDACTYMVPLGLELYGFADAGRGWKHLLDHGIGLDAPVPVNTHGGNLSEAYIHGMTHVIEGVRQLRGTSPNQHPDAQNVLVGNMGVTSALFLGRAA